ncbi:oxidoreductase [Lottiidibacillus patelloidae]|uniref:Oxidoreductase n=1 Tax=Lottiidibacillus patelloidae TaxID=2670334 RepID=A0A263BYB1_9BACI|nr:aldo/keto reductase [Lottiidibacillus patelloidae]OZM58704.1 oxidoreductase [Lottiidibacillus patelloidae]
MKKNRLGNSSIHVSEIGLGCMSLGTNFENAKRIIDEAIESGVNFIDTADLYDYGLNEEFVGKTLKNHNRDNIILATKVGNRWEQGQTGWQWDPSPSHIKEAVKQSLKRLQTDYIDLYQLHGGTLEDPIDEIINAFEELKKEGLIKEYGISSIRPNVIKEYVERSNIVSVMMQYSILDRRPEELLDYLAGNNVSVIARGPLAKGLLTEDWEKIIARKFENKTFLSYDQEQLHTQIQQLENSRIDLSMQAIALKYVLAHPAVATAIPGASSLEQFQKNRDALSEPTLEPLQLHEIKRLAKQLKYESHRI